MDIFIKSCDTLNKDLSTSENNSLYRGIVNILLFVSFISINIYLLINKIIFPEPYDIVDMNLLDRRSVNLDSIQSHFRILLREQYKLNTDINICHPYVKIGNSTYNFNVSEKINVEKKTVYLYYESNITHQSNPIYKNYDYDNWYIIKKNNYTNTIVSIE